MLPFPFSYKLWYNYLKLRRKQVKDKCITDPAYEEVNNAFERALVFMHKVSPPNSITEVQYRACCVSWKYNLFNS